jgi:uncharacterized membrane protein YkvA (DUF1232 family)
MPIADQRHHGGMSGGSRRDERRLSEERTTPPADPFPRNAVMAMVRRLPAYARLSLTLARDPRLSRRRRAAVLAAAGYVISPIDIVPGFIPGIGQLDDMAVALAAIRYALGGLDPQTRGTHLAAAGLAEADLSTDLRTVARTTGWLVRAGGRAGVRVAKGGVAIATSAGGIARRALRSAVGLTRRTPIRRETDQDP